MHTPAPRLNLDFCAAVLIDVQEYFLKDVEPAERARLLRTMAAFAELTAYLHLPTVCTIEKPIAMKGTLPTDLKTRLSPSAIILEKNFFDLTAEDEIADAIAGLNRRQLVVAGCETDVCVLQSCLGLLNKGYEVFVVEDLLFSSSLEIKSAILRMRDAGAVFLTYKTLYYELVRAVSGSPYRHSLVEKFGETPDSLQNFKF